MKKNIFHVVEVGSIMFTWIKENWQKFVNKNNKEVEI